MLVLGFEFQKFRIFKILNFHPCTRIVELASGFTVFQGFSSNFGKRSLAKLGKVIDLTSKLGESNDTEHNKGSKIYP